MAFRKSGRSMAQDMATSSEEVRLVASQGDIVWRMYSVYNPADHGAWCITSNTFNDKDRIPAAEWAKRVDGELRFLLFETDPAIKRFYDKEKWGVLAGPPEARPKFGKPFPIRPGDRAEMIAVPKGEKTEQSGIKSRITALRKDFEPGKYPGEDTVWFGNIRQTPELVEWYELGSPEPTVTVSRTSTEINTGQTKFGHDPDKVIYNSHVTNPQTKHVPSTAAMPVTTYIPYMGEIIAIIALFKSIASFLNKNSNQERYSYTFITHPTEVIDYEELKNRVE